MTPALEYFPGEIPADVEHPAEEAPSLLLHFHFCQEDLDSIVTLVLPDLRRPRRAPPKTRRMIRAVPRFSVANPRGAIPQIKRGVNRNAKVWFPHSVLEPSEN